jgi:hypothetical protein
MNYKPKRPDPHAPPRFAGKYGGKINYRNTSTSVLTPKPFIRVTEVPDSLNPSQTGAPHAAKVDPNKYTGTACIGIAAMHKSNLVPVFNSQAAIDAATMRRN